MKQMTDALVIYRNDVQYHSGSTLMDAAVVSNTTSILVEANPIWNASQITFSYNSVTGDNSYPVSTSYNTITSNSESLHTDGTSFLLGGIMLGIKKYRMNSIC